MQKYHISLRILHWFMAFVVIGLIASGWFMVGLSNDTPYKWDVYGLHKSFGVSVLLLVIIRIVMRIQKGAPVLPDSFSSLIKKLSNITHKSLYAFMLIIPITGYMMSVLAGYDVVFFGIKLPKLFAENKDVAKLFKQAHEILPYIALGVIVMHIAATLKHQIVDRYNILQRML